ncbi:MAG TPA: MFS transporter, partial [Acidobacteriota bacterium]|nr:MFS transporter [Acidobacteriota bacterium]
MKLWDRLRELPSATWLLFLATLVNRAGTMVLPFMALYLIRSLHFTESRAGLVLAIYGAGALVAAPVSGRLADRYGALFILSAALLSSAATMLLFPLAHSFVSVCVMTVLFALTTEMFRPPALAMVSMTAPPAQRKAAFAVIRTATNLGMSLGPALGGFLASVSFVWLFVIDGVTSIAAAVILMIWFPKVAKTKSEEVAPRPVLHGSAIFADRLLLRFLIATVPVIIVFFQHISGMPLFMVQYLGLSPAVYGLMFTLNTVLLVLVEVPFNLAVSHWSDRKILGLGSVLIAVGYGAMAFTHNAWQIAITVLVWTFGEMTLMPGLLSTVSHLAPPDRQGEYMGFFTMTFSISFIIGPWLGTQLLSHYGPMVLWITMFAIGMIS